MIHCLGWVLFVMSLVILFYWMDRREETAMPKIRFVDGGPGRPTAPSTIEVPYDEYVPPEQLAALVEAGRVWLNYAYSIKNGRKASIGSIDNSYMPQLRRDFLDRDAELLRAALAPFTKDTPDAITE